MNQIKTPCIGICSTTSFGDKICRGCQRFGFEVLGWHAYSEEEKLAVLRRIDQLSSQIMSARFKISSVEKLEQVMADFRFFYDPMISPYCWLHNLLQKHFYRIENLSDIGVELTPEYRNWDVRDLLIEINKELLVLSEAHFERYFQRV
jgi:uncharacterized protein